MSKIRNCKKDKSHLFISGLYVLISILWILFSDKLVEIVVESTNLTLSLLQTLKGIFFVTATGMVLYILIKSRVDMLRISEEKFITLAENSPDAIMRIDREYRYIYVNSSIKEQTGLSAEYCIGKKATALGFKEDACLHWCNAVDKVFTSRKSTRIEFQSASGLWIESILAPEFSNTGEVISAVAIARDITEIKNAYRSLEISEYRYRTLFEAAGDGVMLLDATSIIDCNDQCVKLFEYSSKEEIIGKHPGQLSPKQQPNGRDSIEMARDNIVQVLKGNPVIFDWKHQTAKGTEIDVSISLSRIEAQVDTFVAIIRNISELRKTQEQLRQSQKMQAVGQLAAGIAHDFNNILCAIIGYSDMALDLVSNDCTLGKYMRNILNAGDRAKHLTSQILTFSRQGPEQKRSVNLSPIINEVLELLRSTLPSTVEITSWISKDTCPVIADLTKVHEVLMNLATNAVHAMGEKGVLTITLKEETLTEKRSEGIIGPIKPGFYSVIEVCDTGTGIDNAIISRIFEPFYTTKKDNEGTGLGLSVVYGVMQSHHGNIEVESTVGQGAVFRLFFPKTNEQIISETASRVPAPMGNERIMYVDDEKILAEMGKDMLISLGYEVSVFTDSRDALQMIKEHINDFDLLITDQTMPFCTGIDLTKAALEIDPDFPIILCTGFSSKVDEQNAKEIGCRDFVTKPLTMRILAEKIRAIFDKKIEIA